MDPISAPASVPQNIPALPDVAPPPPPSTTPVIAALSHVANAGATASSEVLPPIRLEDVPEQFRAQFKLLRTVPSHALDAVQAPWPPKATEAVKTIFGDDFRAFLGYKRGMFKQIDDSSSEIPGRPTWPRAHLEIKDKKCRMESPAGCVQVEFPIAANEIKITFSGCEKIIRFPDQRRLARCGIGVPRHWKAVASQDRHEAKLQPIYAIDRFQPLVLSPDEKTVFCILDKSDELPVLQKIQEECEELIDMPAGFASEIRHVSGMACNASSALFIYCGQSGEERLHILEDGHWCHLELHHANPANDPNVDHVIDPASAFFISAVAPDGSSLVLTPHDVEQQPRLIRLKDTHHRDRRQDDKRDRRLEYWKLPLAGCNDGWQAPCLFAYSPNSGHLALASRNLFTRVLYDKKAFIINLNELSPASVPIGGNVPTLGSHCKIARALWIEHPDWMPLPAHIDSNDISLSFGDQGLTLTKAIYDEEADVTLTYTAGLPPSMVFRPIFADPAQRAQAEIARLKEQSKSQHRPVQSRNAHTAHAADSDAKVHFPSPSNSSSSP
jgi:hypothetical protein